MVNSLDRHSEDDSCREPKEDWGRGTAVIERELFRSKRGSSIVLSEQH